MGEDRQAADETLWRAVTSVARAERPEEIEQFVAEHPRIAAREFLDQLDHRIDEIERTGGGDWWGLTRARVLLGGYHDGDLKDALFRCWTRDLLPIGPDDIRRRVAEHPELLGERADDLLRHWASKQRAAGQEQKAAQIELRLGLLRELAADRMRGLVETAMQQEREFQLSGDVTKLDQALATRRSLVRDQDAPFVSVEARIAHSQAVSRLLQKRFRAAGSLADINDALAEAEQGVATLPEGHPFRQMLLTELGNSLSLRFREFGVADDINRAIEIFDAIAARTDNPILDQEDRFTPQANQATAYLDRYFAAKDPRDLNRSIELFRSIVSSTPLASPRRPLRVNNLGSALYLGFCINRDLATLREAITFQREATETEDISLRIHALAALARSLDAAEQAGERNAEDSATIFRQVCQLGLQLNVGAAMWAGMTWGRESWARDNLDAAAEAYGYCSDGARLLFSTQGAEGSQEIRLSQFREAAPRAAFALASAGRVDDAVVVFELSRAQLLIQAIERGLTLRRAPDLDSEVRTEVLTKTHASRRAFNIDDIVAAAERTALLYFVSTDKGGLALLVHQRKVTPIALPRLGSQAVAERVSTYLTGLATPRQRKRAIALDDTTAWLWDVAMGPVLEQLDGVDTMVLVPGGLLGLLPLHAAWTPEAGRPTGRRYALDMAVFSYAPSARSLGVARARASQRITGQTLIVADPKSAASQPLEFANDEAKIVAWHFSESDVLPDKEKEATLAAVSGLLSKATVAHFACHGFADLDTPLQSGVLLAGDEVLRVRQIRDLNVNARLAVLSACKTAVAGARLPDEVVAMPTGLLQAGVAGIVASLWSVSDRATTMLMAEFYRQLCREKQSPAAALRGAQQWLRDTSNVEKARTWELGGGDWLPPDVAKRLCSSIGETAERAYSSPWWWAAFVQVGA